MGVKRKNEMEIAMKKHRNKKRPPTPEERAYMAYVKTKPCVINNIECGGRTCAHHVGVRLGDSKNHQKLMPLCEAHHDCNGVNGVAFHATGRKTWESKYGTENELHGAFVAKTGGYEAFIEGVKA